MTRFAVPVSALIICKNEADMIGECLESLDFCSEIVIVDSGSTDETLEIIGRYRAEGFPIKLMHNEWPGFPRQRLFALGHARQPWCLCIEADERVDNDLKRSIVDAVNSNRSIDGWYIRRRDWLRGYGYAHRWVAHNRLLRLFRRDKVSIDVTVRVHESFEVQGKTAVMAKGALLHRRAMSLRDDMARANSYSTLKVATLLEQGSKPRLAKLVFAPLGNFLKFYLLKRYFLCGRHGFVYAMMVVVYSFATEAKLFEANQPEAE